MQHRKSPAGFPAMQSIRPGAADEAGDTAPETAPKFRSRTFRALASPSFTPKLTLPPQMRKLQSI